MFRFIIIGLAVVVVWMLILQVMQFIKTRKIDWTGIAFMIGFVVIAFFLRDSLGFG